MAETIGSLVDKISIVELKIYHMLEQAERTDVPQEHRDNSIRKVTVMREQRDDLKAELGELFEAVMAGKKKLKVYRQFKMYNDPIYKTSQSPS